MVPPCTRSWTGEATAVEALIRDHRPDLDVLPSSLALAGAEVELVALPAREHRLAAALRPLVAHYDHVIIDCPPSLGLLTVCALTAAQRVLVPVQCEYLALEGLTQLMRSIALVRQSLNPRLRIAGVLLTMYDARTNLSAAGGGRGTPALSPGSLPHGRAA